MTTTTTLAEVASLEGEEPGSSDVHEITDRLQLTLSAVTGVDDGDMPVRITEPVHREHAG